MATPLPPLPGENLVGHVLFMSLWNDRTSNIWYFILRNIYSFKTNAVGVRLAVRYALKLRHTPMRTWGKNKLPEIVTFQWLCTAGVKRGKLYRTFKRGKLYSRCQARELNCAAGVKRGKLYSRYQARETVQPVPNAAKWTATSRCLKERKTI